MPENLWMMSCFKNLSYYNYAVRMWSSYPHFLGAIVIVL